MLSLNSLFNKFWCFDFTMKEDLLNFVSRRTISLSFFISYCGICSVNYKKTEAKSLKDNFVLICGKFPRMV